MIFLPTSKADQLTHQLQFMHIAYRATRIEDSSRGSRHRAITGIVTPGDRIRAAAGNRVVYRDGVPIAAMEGDMLKTLAPLDADVAEQAAAAAAGRRVPVVRGFVGRR